MRKLCNYCLIRRGWFKEDSSRRRRGKESRRGRGSIGSAAGGVPGGSGIRCMFAQVVCVPLGCQ